MKTLVSRFLSDPNVDVYHRPDSGIWWEEGHIIVPKACWPGVRRAIVKSYNTYQDWLLYEAREIYNILKLEKKRGDNYRTLLATCDRAQEHGPAFIEAVKPAFFRDSLSDKLYKPKQCDFPQAAPQAASLQYGQDAWLHIHSRVLHWQVAGKTKQRTHELGHVHELFTIISTLPYVKGTGGVIYTYAGAVGFGPLGAKKG
jgi:hypothetical protein